LEVFHVATSETPGITPALVNDGRQVRTEVCPRRLRVFFAGEVIADSTRVLYLFEKNHLPIYYFPWEDVRRDLLVPSDRTSKSPHKGDAVYWSIEVNGRRSADAVWSYRNPFPEVSEIADHAAFYWDRVDAWFEEDDEVFVHARDPYKRVDVLQSSRHVEVVAGGVVVADTKSPRLLFETRLPTRYYIPKIDVRLDLLQPSATQTRCPYKGVASYFSLDTGHAHIDDVAWIYPAPIPEIPKIENLVAFFNERVDRIVIDGVAEVKPVTRWS
jgi:uncharacterized protein (DUF427 family)